MITKPIRPNILENLITNAHTLIKDGYYDEPKYVLSMKPRLSLVLESKFAILAELKLSSPNSKHFFDPSEVEARLQMMTENADGISILTEPNYFFGSLKFLTKAIQRNIPTLMKDIIVSEDQIRAGKNASAILLIARVLSFDQIIAFIKYAKKLNLEVVLEVDNELDFQKYIDTEAHIIAINNRNLSTFKVDLEISNKIMTKYATDKPVIGFSGYSNSKEVMKAKNSGLSGILVGTKLSATPSPDKFLQNLNQEIGGIYV